MTCYEHGCAYSLEGIPLEFECAIGLLGKSMTSLLAQKNFIDFMDFIDVDWITSWVPPHPQVRVEWEGTSESFTGDFRGGNSAVRLRGGFAQKSRLMCIPLMGGGESATVGVSDRGHVGNDYSRRAFKSRRCKTKEDTETDFPCGGKGRGVLQTGEYVRVENVLRIPTFGGGHDTIGVTIDFPGHVCSVSGEKYVWKDFAEGCERCLGLFILEDFSTNASGTCQKDRVLEVFAFECRCLSGDFEKRDGFGKMDHALAGRANCEAPEGSPAKVTLTVTHR